MLTLTTFLLTNRRNALESRCSMVTMIFNSIYLQEDDDEVSSSAGASEREIAVCDKGFCDGNQSDLCTQCTWFQRVDRNSSSYAFPRKLIIFDMVKMYRRTCAAYDGHSHALTLCSVDGPQPQALNILVVVPRSYHGTVCKVLSTVVARCRIE